MAGLLDGYGIDPMAMGLLGAGGALLTPRQQGGGIGAALQAFPAGMMQGQLMQQRMQMDAMRAKLIQSGIDENEAQALVRKAMAEKQMADQAQMAQQRAGQQSILGGIASGQQPGFRDASIAMGGTAPAGYQPPGQRNPITQDVVAKWMSFGGDPDVLKKLAESGDWGRREVARVLETADAQGRPQQQQMDKFGGQVGPTFARAYEKKFQDFGGTVGVMDGFTGQQSGSFGKTMTPGEVASNAVARGNLGVAQGNLGLSRERFAFDKAQAGGGGNDVQYITTPNGIVAVPKKPGDGAIAGRTVNDPVTGLPMGGTETGNKSQRVAEANEAIALLDQAEKLIDKSTSSYGGFAVDKAAQVGGFATPGAQAAAQLRALEGALIAKMPKMSGPQSDKDVLLYKQMAGQIGDPTIPAATKKAALSTIREIQNRAAGIVAPGQAGLGTGEVSGRVGGSVNLQELARQEMARRAAGGGRGSN